MIRQESDFDTPFVDYRSRGYTIELVGTDNANAIERVTGRRLTELPVSPPKVLAAIEARSEKS